MDRASAIKIGQIDPKLKGKAAQAAVNAAMNPPKPQPTNKKK